MAKLKSGVLLKLLEDMNSNYNTLEMDDKRHVLLQIRGIVPVMEKGDLWPNRGFYLRVSDLSHAIYVSLTHKHHEMILSNELKLGQYIYVQMLEKSEPVPLLRGIKPVPGSRKCEGFPEDTPKFLKQIKSLEQESIVEKGVISEEVTEDSRKLSLEGSPQRIIRSFSASKVRPTRKGPPRITAKPNVEKRSFGIRSGSSSVEHTSYSESNLSSVSCTRTSKRRSWNETEIRRVNSSMVRHEIKPFTRSANASPIRRAMYESSDDNSSSTKRLVIGAPRKLVQSTKSRTVPAPNVKLEHVSFPPCLIGEKKGAEEVIAWGSLPPNLFKLGKEIMKQSDIALLAAADALQEACVADRLLNCLSTFPDFHQTEGDDLQPYADKFFDLQENLAQSILIAQSLKTISNLTSSATDSAGSGSDKDALNIGVERKKNAISWIKSAMAVDLSPCFNSLDRVNCSSERTLQAAKRAAIPLRGAKPQGAIIVKSQRRSEDIPLISLQRQSEDIPLVSISDKDEHPGWTRGSTLGASTELATSLQDECRNSFLVHVENYLDEVERKSSTYGSDGEIAGMLIKIKKVNNWLDNIVNKEAASNSDDCEGSFNSDEPGMEACRRVRNKIYMILLKHVERTALALENTSS